MGIFYSLDMGEPASSEGIGDALARTVVDRQLAKSRDLIRVDKNPLALDLGTKVSSHASSPLPFLDPMEEVFGFVPVAFGFFNMYYPADMSEQTRDMVIMVGDVLGEVDGDAWFGFNGEITYLTRIGGRITVDTDEPFWTPELVALLPPHDSAPLPNL